jgi:glucokinase
MVNKQVIGIDLGGTAIKLGRFDREGKCLQTLTVPTPQPATPDAVVNAIVAAIAQINQEKTAIAIGLGTPGPADVNGRIARVAINLTGWQDVPLADLLEQKTGLPTIIANDANCAGLGEFWQGSGQNFSDMILLTLGTGVGGAIIINNKLFVGPKGSGGELGLITFNPDGFPCNSGNQGSLEQYLSIQAIKRETGLEPIELGKLAEKGEQKALEFWQNYGRILGIGLTSLIYVLTPEAIIISGGISASFPYFYPSMLAEIEKRVLFSSRERLKILPAELGNNAGIFGAAKLALDL